MLKAKVVRLVNQFGVTQKFLAARMGLTEAMLSRWLNDDQPEPRIPLAALDGFERYERDLMKALTTPEPLPKVKSRVG